MNSSVTSFYSEREARMDQDAHDKVKKATKKPFDMTRRSTQNLKSGGSGQKEDDMLSEISTPDINWKERSKIMEALENREKDRQELELEQTF